MLRKAFKAFVVISCVAFAGCSATNGLVRSSAQDASLVPKQTHARTVADKIMVVPGDVTNCNSAQPSSNANASQPAGSISALPGGSISALPGGSISALPGGSISALPGGSISALPGGSATGQATVCANNKRDKVHAVAHEGGKHNGAPGCPIGTGTTNEVRCGNLLRTDIPAVVGTIIDLSQIPGLHPSDLADAYRLPSDGGSGQTVAIVDAFDDPNAESDLGVYRQEFGLPACTTANGCFRKTGVNSGHLPASNASWALETSLDLDMVSAVCPSCNILLVEANSATLDDLGAAVDFAAANGATVISNSYYVAESQLKQSDVTKETAHYNHPGIPMTVSSGDNSTGATFPASLPNVIAVGATSLVRQQGDRGWYETAWSGTGSGCSAFSSKPSWQTDSCANRNVADVSAVGDPDTGVAIFSSYGGTTGWYVMGGTSVGAPIVASIIALAADGASLNGAAKAYANAANSLFPVMAGTNGTCSGPNNTCTPAVGYNSPTGMGTPNGAAAF